MKHKRLPTGLFYHPRSKYLYFKIKKWDAKKGKNVWSSPISSKTEDIALALKTKEETQALSDAVSQAQGNETISHDAALQLVNKVLRWHGVPELEKQTVPTWGIFKQNWLDSEKKIFESRSHKPGIDPLKEHRVYISRLKQFDTWLGDPDINLSRISRDDCQMFYSDMIDLGYRPSTVKATIAILKRIFGLAVDDGLIAINPWLRVRTSGNQYRQNEPFTSADLDRIWSHVRELEHGQEWLTACLFGITLGVRIKDSTVRTWQEIHLGGKPYISYLSGKTNGRVQAPIVEPLLSHISGLNKSGEYLTPNLAELPTSDLSRIFSGLLRNIGIPMEKEEGLKTWYSKGFHSFRHTLPSLLAANGVDEKIRMEIIGHSDSATHHQYTHIDDERLRDHLAKALQGIKVA